MIFRSVFLNYILFIRQTPSLMATGVLFIESPRD